VPQGKEAMKQPERANQRPLSGIRVLDLTLFLSGPYATQILGDLGAEVLKLEPKAGDDTRHLPPHFVGKDSAYFLSVNRNKRSIQIDYKTPEGLALLDKLTGECDVVIENNRPGHLARYGIDHQRFRAKYPRIVWCSITGFGQDGPYAQRPAYDMIVQALSGGMSMTGEPSGKPVRSAIPLGDIAAGMYAVTAINAALVGRAQHGRGDFIDIGMLDCQVAMLSYQAAYHLHSGDIPGRQGRAHDSIPTYRAFTAGDGVDFVVCANTDRMWRSFCKAVGVPGLPDQPAFTGDGRYTRKTELAAIFEPIVLTKPASEWVALLQEAEIPVALVNTLDQTMADPQVLHRGMVLQMNDGDSHTARVSGDPMKFASSDGAYSYPPKLGADTVPVLQCVLKMDDAEIRRLVKAGAIADRPVDEATAAVSAP
jgi:crotonobetainyl-CoA:carnitine CoA-transferase CaiB-like acyl-CoA transferase